MEAMNEHQEQYMVNYGPSDQNNHNLMVSISPQFYDSRQNLTDYHVLQGMEQFSNEEQAHQQTAQFQIQPHKRQQSLTPHTVSDMSISPYPTVQKHEVMDAEHEQEDQLDDIYQPGQLYPAESNFDANEYQENRTYYAPRQMQVSAPVAGEEQQYNQIQVQEVAFGGEQEEQQRIKPRFLQPSQSLNNSVQSLQMQPQGSQSSLMRQFSEKIKTQAERLQKLESYKKLCERRIQDFEPQHALPITEEMIGAPCEVTRDLSAPKGQQADLRRQLALKEQDLNYAQQRSEKAIKENEYLQQEIAELKLRQRPAEDNQNNEIQDQLKMLVDEKNALLDYIEESVNITVDNSVSPLSAEKEKPYENQPQNHKLTLNDMKSQIDRLQSDKIDLSRQNDELAYKIAQLEHFSQPNIGSSRREETFGNLPTALSSRTAGPPTIMTNKDMQVMSNATLTQVQSIDYMVLDLNAAKQELMETQNQFNMTQNQLNSIKQENDDLQLRLEEAQSRIVDLEQQIMVMPAPQLHAAPITGSGQNPWANTLRSTLMSADLQSEEPDREYKVKLMEERDRLHDKTSELTDRLRAQMDENTVLKTTLDETQHELENLINEHEKVRRDVIDGQGLIREAQDLPRRLRQEAQGIHDQLDERNQEVYTLQGEIKTLSQQAEMNLETLKQLRTQNLKLEAQIIETRDCDVNKVQSHRKQWEMTIDDLSRDLKEAQATIVQKETIFQKVERELRNKLHEVEDANSQKSNMLRRIEDLNHEVRQLQANNERKESETKEQVRQSEEVQFELERVQLHLQKANHDKEQTQDLRREDCGLVEAAQSKVDRQAKVISKICRDVGKVQELISSIQKEFQLSTRIQVDSAVASATPQSHRQGSTAQLEDQLRSANGFLKSIGDWLVSFAKAYKHSQKSLDLAQSEIDGANHKAKVLEQRLASTQQEGFMVQEQGRHLTIELETLKDEVAETQNIQKDGFEREERIHKRNQYLKSQIEAIKIQKEKLSLQIKTLLGEKEQLKETIDHKSQEIEEIDERSKMYELQVSQLIEQKQSVLDLFTRFKDAFPSDSLRQVFAQIIDVVKHGHQIDQHFVETENELLSKEGQLRKYAKREVEGLLSTKVINIRKEVEQGRIGLREMTQTRDELQDRLTELEQELKQNETIERRRTDVALETEQSLTLVRQEIQDARRELIFTQRNRNDLELALKASQQEREMIQRELMTLRHQLQLKADLMPNTIGDRQHISGAGTLSTAQKLTSYHATQSSVQTAADNPPSYRASSADKLAPQPSVSLRYGNPQPKENFIAPIEHNPSHEIQIQQLHAHKMTIQEQSRNLNPAEMPLKRRFPSQEPALYTNENQNDVNFRQKYHHQPMHSDMPLQMPNLTDRATEKMRPSMYGGVMSGNGALVTTAAGTLYDQNHQRPPTSARQTGDQNSTRPPTYQTTQSASKRTPTSAANNIVSFNPLPHTGASKVPEQQYMTANFAKESANGDHQSSIYEKNVDPSVQTMRFTHQNTHANSQSNLYNGGFQATNLPANNHNNSSQINSGEPLQPIMSQYGGELTSRSSRKSPAAFNQHRRYQDLLGDNDRSRESPLRSSRVPQTNTKQQLGYSMQKAEAVNKLANNSSVGEDSKLDAQAFAQQNRSSQQSQSAYNQHRSSINESSIHNKLSALRNVFTQIRQNLDESSMNGTRTAGPHSSIDQSMVQTNEFC